MNFQNIGHTIHYGLPFSCEFNIKFNYIFTECHTHTQGRENSNVPESLNQSPIQTLSQPP